MLQSFIIPKEVAANPGWSNAVNRAGEWAVETLGRWKENKHFTWRLRPGTGEHPVFDLRMEARSI